jgi:hypothetical protein
MNMPECHWITDEIITVTDFFSERECEETIRLGESIGFDPAPINTARGPGIHEARNNTRAMLDDPALAESLWKRIGDYIPDVIEGCTACGVNERFRIYRYDFGQKFDWHRDGCHERAGGDRSRLTFMVYLNEGFDGGETTFETENIVPAQGMALFFMHHLAHKGQAVLDGRKYVLRTDVMYRRTDTTIDVRVSVLVDGPVGIT